MDGVNDADESSLTCIQDPKCRTEGPDSDGDGLYDQDEIPACVELPDCDGDGLGDSEEILACMLKKDCDDDGLNDPDEPNNQCIQDPWCGPRGPLAASVEVSGDA